MKSKYSQYYKAHPLTFKRANELRHNETFAEKQLWEVLRGSQIKKLKFRRQHPVGPFIADFYCHKLKLIIELDGPVHDLPHIKFNDGERQKYLEEVGITVLRFSNETVLENYDLVVQAINSLL